jgi:hypothetical protein
VHIFVSLAILFPQTVYCLACSGIVWNFLHDMLQYLCLHLSLICLFICSASKFMRYLITSL